MQSKHRKGFESGQKSDSPHRVDTVEEEMEIAVLLESVEAFIVTENTGHHVWWGKKFTGIKSAFHLLEPPTPMSVSQTCNNLLRSAFQLPANSSTVLQLYS